MTLFIGSFAITFIVAYAIGFMAGRKREIDRFRRKYSESRFVAPEPSV